MAKRFTDSRKFEDMWYRKLTPLHKCLWEYLLATCSHAGVGEFDEEVATLRIGGKVTKSDILETFGDRVRFISDYKFFIPKYLSFQYHSGLNSNKPVLVSVRKELKRHGLEKTVQELFGDDYLTIDESLANHSVTIKEKGKDKKIEKNKNKKAIYEEIKELWNSYEGLPSIRKISKEREKALSPLVKEYPDLEVWRKIMEKIVQSKFLMNEMDKDWKISFDWLLKPDSILKILEGNYDSLKSPNKASKPKSIQSDEELFLRTLSSGNNTEFPERKGEG